MPDFIEFSRCVGTYSSAKFELLRYKIPFNRLLLFYLNYLPIQCIMFSRELYEKAGGFDESLDALEDWDLWVRYAMLTDFLYFPEVTSYYYTPYKSGKKRGRGVVLNNTRKNLEEKFSGYKMELSVQEVNREMDYIVNVLKKRSLTIYLRKIRDYLMYKAYGNINSY